MSKHRNSKSYYDVAGVSAEETIYACNMKFAAGNSLKYLWRNNYDNPKNSEDKESDMKKVLHYLEQARKDTNYPKINKAEAIIKTLDENAWPERIYKAIVLIIVATASRGAKPYNMYTEAIESISEELVECS